MKFLSGEQSAPDRENRRAGEDKRVEGISALRDESTRRDAHRDYRSETARCGGRGGA